jgi:transcriptional regulator with XRE-family HTH domain
VTAETSKEQFADRVRRLMAAKNIDVPKLAARGQLQASAIYQWLAAKFMPRGENLYKLARALDASTDYLLSGGADYDGFEDRQIAVHESFSLYLRGKGITPLHPDYEMYDRVKQTAKSPVPATVEEWEHLTTSIIPIIQEYSNKRKLAKAGVQPHKSQRELTRKPGSVLHLRKPKNRHAG